MVLMRVYDSDAALSPCARGGIKRGAAYLIV